MRLARAIACAAVCVLAAAPMLAPGKSARAHPTPYYPEDIGIIAVDDAHEHVFLPQGDDKTSLVVVDFEGRQVATIKRMFNVGGMVVSGPTLYVALRDSIKAIDTATLKVVDSFDLDTIITPLGLALAGGKLWFGGDSNCGFQESKLSSVDLATREVEQYETSHPEALTCPFLHSSSLHPNILLVGNREEFLSLLALDVSGEEPREIFFEQELGPGYLLPDGTRILTGNASQTGLVHLADGSGIPGFRYRGESLWRGYNVSGDGSLVAATSEKIESRMYPYPVVYVYDTETLNLVNTFRLWDCIDPYHFVEVKHVAFSADGSRLFVSTSVYLHMASQEPLGQLHVFSTASKPARLRLKATRDGKRGVDLAARLSHTGRSDNDKVRIYARVDNSNYGSAYGFGRVAQGRVDESGHFRAHAKLPPGRRPVAYWAQWRGDATGRKCTASKLVPPR